MRHHNLLSKVLISVTITIVVTACSFNSAPVYDPNNLNSNQNLRTQYDHNGQYYYCKEESCVQPTKLEEYSERDLQPLKPDATPPLIVVKDTTPVKKKPKYKKHKIKRKPKSTIAKKPITQTKCFVVTPNESGTFQIEGNKLVPVSQGNDVQIMNSLESAVKIKKTAPVNTPVKVAPTTKTGINPKPSST